MICNLFSEPSYLFFSSDLPGLLYYSHLPTALIALLVGFFVYWNGRQFLLNQLLFAISIFFSLWIFSNLFLWTNIHSDFLLFIWSFLRVLSSLISIFCVYFVYVFLNKKDISFRLKSIFLTLLVPVIVLAASSLNVNGFNLTNCDAFAFEGDLFRFYRVASGILAMLWILILLVRKYHAVAPDFRKQMVLMGIGIEFFLFSFFTITFLAAYLTDLGILSDSRIEFYGLFGMTVFMIFIGILMVRFKIFHVSLIAAQALITALVVLIGSQFTFVKSTTALILTGVTLVLTGAIGVILIRSVRREIKQREHIELLARDLELANDQQVTLIHFITHQIKGFVTKSRNIFSMMKEGDFGVLPDTMTSIVDQGFASDTSGLATIQEILNAANIKSGKVTFTMASFDLKALIEGVVRDLKPAADAKSLSLVSNLGTEPLMVNGDAIQLVNAYKNLIDNSIKYTPSGSVSLNLEKKDGKAVLTIADTGVGITPEDMKNLFTEGGHGKESTKVNVESTGFGLYIVKNLIEAHKGRVWAESEGAGKGSRFIVELPI